MINKLVNRKTIQKTNGIVELQQNGNVFELHIKVIFIKKASITSGLRTNEN